MALMLSGMPGWRLRLQGPFKAASIQTLGIGGALTFCAPARHDPYRLVLLSPREQRRPPVGAGPSLDCIAKRYLPPSPLSRQGDDRDDHPKRRREPRIADRRRGRLHLFVRPVAKWSRSLGAVGLHRQSCAPPPRFARA